MVENSVTHFSLVVIHSSYKNNVTYTNTLMSYSDVIKGLIYGPLIQAVQLRELIVFISRLLTKFAHLVVKNSGTLQAFRFEKKIESSEQTD